MRHAALLVVSTVLVAEVRSSSAETLRIEHVDVVIVAGEDEATLARIEGQTSDLPVEIHAVRPEAAASSPLRVSFETRDDRSRRITLSDARTGRTQSRRIELPDGPAALSTQREALALTARRMIKAALEGSNSPPPEPIPVHADARKSWQFAAIATAAGSLGPSSSLRALRGDLRATGRHGLWRFDLGLAGVRRAFEVSGYRWAVEGLGPMVALGLEQPWGSSRLYAGFGASYVVGTRVADGAAAAGDADKGFVLPRLELALRYPVAAGLWCGISLAAEAEWPQTDYRLQRASGGETLASSDVIEPSAGLQFSWDVPEAP